MPKIIANVKDQIISEAKRQINQNGYESTTIRSVAQGCNIAVGTVYNYFKSKDMLIASFVLQDWLLCVDSINKYPKENKRDFLSYIYESLLLFAGKYDPLFKDKAAAKVFTQSFSDRHRQMRDRLSEMIMPIAPERFTAEFVAEALLCWTMAGKSFDDIYELLPEKIK